MQFLKIFIPAAISCGCNATANIFWKLRFNKVPLSLKSVSDFLGLITSVYIWAGVCCYGISMLIFFYLLSNYKLSTIIPITCMTYIFNIISARIVFKENISVIQYVGISVIILGLLIISRDGALK